MPEEASDGDGDGDGGGVGRAKAVGDYVDVKRVGSEQLEEAAPAMGEVDGVARRAGMEVRARRLEADLLRSPHEAAPGKEAARGLQLGSADPHMVREPGEVREPWRQRGGAFSINTLDPAEWEELCVRAFPVMNPIPCTVARVGQWSQPPDPPVIESIEQVVPVETLRKIGRWKARLKACLKAASRGSYGLAKQLRPPDLVLRSVEHTVAWAQGWVWDLRPLARGERAVPIAESTLEAPPLTDLKLGCVAALGAKYADKEIVAEMLTGFSDDAVGVEEHVVFSPPHLGALKYAAQACEKVDSDVGKGWSRVEEAIPFWPIRSNPYSIVREEREAKVKYRMTIDLSWPHPSAGGGAVSVNDSIDRSLWVQVKLMRVAQLAESVAILMTIGVPVLLWAFDCQAYYRKTGRQRREVWRNCVAVAEGFVVDEREQFGDASAAVKCCRQSSFLAWLVARALKRVDVEFPPVDHRVLAWIERRREARVGVEEGSDVGACGIYVDDGGGASIDDCLVSEGGAPALKYGPDERGCEGEHRGAPMRRAEAHFRAAVMAIAETGHSSEVSKEAPPREKNVVLGVELDVVGEGRMRLSKWKREKYAERARRVLAGNAVCAGEEFESLLHRLLFAAVTMPEGRQYLNPLFRVAKAKFRLSGGKVMVTARVRGALSWWIEHLGGSHEGVPLACRGAFPSVESGEVVVMYSDASGGYGFGAWTLWRGEVLYIADTWDAAEQSDVHINVKELLATSAALATFLEATAATYAVEFTDNTVAECAARRNAPSAPQLQRLVERRVAMLRERGGFTEMARVGTHENIWADLISREGGLSQFLEQVASLRLAARRLCVAAEWRSTVELRTRAEDPELECAALAPVAGGGSSSGVLPAAGEGGAV